MCVRVCCARSLCVSGCVRSRVRVVLGWGVVFGFLCWSSWEQGERGCRAPLSLRGHEDPSFGLTFTPVWKSPGNTDFSEPFLPAPGLPGRPGRMERPGGRPRPGAEPEPWSLLRPHPAGWPWVRAAVSGFGRFLQKCAQCPRDSGLAGPAMGAVRVGAPQLPHLGCWGGFPGQRGWRWELGRAGRWLPRASGMFKPEEDPAISHGSNYTNCSTP